MPSLQEIEQFADLEMDVDAQLGQTEISLRDLLAIDLGTVIALPKAAGENIDLFMGDELACSGEVVVLHESIAIRITDFREDD